MKKTSSLTKIILTITWALIATTRAVTPPPDGGYPNANTAEGKDALFSLTTGIENTAIGFDALYSNTTGSTNIAVAWAALSNNRSGNLNVAIGGAALSGNVNGTSNIAIGDMTMSDNESGNNNTAAGESALKVNQTGSNNTALGREALYNNQFSNNTATGSFALRTTSFGSNNTADGANALNANMTGSNNIGIGYNAGSKLTTGDNNIDIGNAGKMGESNVIRIGTNGTQVSAFIAGISGTAVSGSPVVVNSNGKLGVATSSARFKEAIQPMDKTSEAILALHPVSFRYKEEIDPDGVPQFGLIAEEVEKVDPHLVGRDEDGKATSVRYEAVNAMLLNEFLKEHRKVEAQERKAQEQEARLAREEKIIAKQQEQIDALNENLRRVSVRSNEQETVSNN